MPDILTTILPAPEQVTTVVPPASITTTLVNGQGPAGTSTRPAYTTSAALSGHQVIALNASGLAYYASADDLSTAFRVVGISTGAAGSGASITVQDKDVMTHNGWSWTPGQLVYLGLNGTLVAAVPVSAAFILVMGKALSSTSMLVGIQPPIAL